MPKPRSLNAISRELTKITISAKGLEQELAPYQAKLQQLYAQQAELMQEFLNREEELNKKEEKE